MSATLAFDVTHCGSFLASRVAEPVVFRDRPDPAMALLIAEIGTVEGVVVEEAPLLFRLVEVYGFAVLAISAVGLASLLA